LNGVEYIPFETALIVDNDCGSVADRIRFHEQKQPADFSVIVDTPAKPIRKTLAMLDGLPARLLLPI
jgi:hypothetical protein